jgi:DMSO/TMAO reductase YedYZ heme-binding membrane subunit
MSVCVCVCVCVCACARCLCTTFLACTHNLSLHACDHRHMIGRVSIGWILLILFIQSLSEGDYLF